MLDINIYNGLPDRTQFEIDDFESGLSAEVINQYIWEDGIVREDKTDKRVEEMMRYAEQYFQTFKAQHELSRRHGSSYIRTWYKENESRMSNHVNSYSDLYSEIAHLQEGGAYGYGMTPWAMCNLVQCALDACEVKGPEGYSALDEKAKEHVRYMLRFGENLMQKLHEKLKREQHRQEQEKIQKARDAKQNEG